MFGTFYVGEHMYTLAATGLRHVDYTFTTRQQAREKMYKIIKRKKLKIVEIYDDKHFKTYVCTKGVNFYISRA